MFIRHRLAQTCARCCVLVLLALSLLAHGTSREECEQQFMPRTGQPGKDVIWVPTNDALVARMLQMAHVTRGDRLYDLGAGDGKIPIAAAKQFGATAVGVEYNPDLVKLAQCYVEAEGVGDRVRIVQGDIFETDFSDATVITLYLLPDLNLRLRPTILNMKPGTRVVSHSFLMDDWEPDERSMSEDGNAYLWIVPAQVAGTWLFRERKGRDRFVVELQQKHQQLSGTFGAEKRVLSKARLKGTEIRLVFSGNGALTRLAGRVEGERIDAEVMRGDSTSSYVGTLLETGASH